MERPCTMTLWRVRPGEEARFQETAVRLAETLLRLPGPPGGLTLVRSVDDPAVFHSIGWFHRAEDLHAMRDDPDARRLLDELVSLCSEVRPSAHSVVHATASAGPAGAER